MRVPQMSMRRRKVISMAGQEARRTGATTDNGGSDNTSTSVTDKPIMVTRTANGTRKESANPKEILKSGDKAKIKEILIDSEKFQEHIQEIDDALINGPALSSVTNTIDDDLDCKTTETADNTLTELRSGGPALEVMLDQGLNKMVYSGSGPIINNPTPRTWKRVLTGPKITNPISEDSHAGNKRGAQDHANDDRETMTKKKKMETEVVKVSKLMAMEFTKMTVVARQHRRDQ